MAPFDKQAPVAEAQENVVPKPEPEANRINLRAMTDEQLMALREEIEGHFRARMEMQQRAQMQARHQCDCGVGRASLMARPESLYTRSRY